MFWNDPNLYGATLPYKDFPIQTPFAFTPFEQFRRFVPQQFPFMPQQFLPQQFLPQQFLPQQIGLPYLPQTFGFVPPYYNLPQTMFDPMLQRGINPFLQPFGLQQPLHNVYRPFIV